jgi:hypothetical protein
MEAVVSAKAAIAAIMIFFVVVMVVSSVCAVRGSLCNDPTFRGAECGAT